MKKILLVFLAVVFLMLSSSISAYALNDNAVESFLQPGNAENVITGPGWFAALRTVYNNYQAHLTYNTSLEASMSNSMINNQWTCPQFLIGNSTMGEVGCESAAVYNALRLRGKSAWYRNVADIICTFERDGYIMNNGTWGSDPYAIGDYFGAESISYLQYTDYTSMKNRVQSTMNSSDQVYIVSYWVNGNSIAGGLHTVAFVASHSAGKIYCYNEVESYQAPMDSFEDYQCVSEDSFIVGYCIPNTGRSVD